jgi:hypothetical protein
MISAWVGPAIVAAVISAIVTAFGWYASHASARRLEAARRSERIQDVQTALRAEIRSQRQRLRLFAEQQEKSGDAASEEPGFTPFVPREAASFVFDAIVSEIHILPTEVIDPVVYYYRQIASLALFAEDLRSDRYASLPADRKAAMAADYIRMGVFAIELADKAIAAIEGGQ